MKNKSVNLKLFNEQKDSVHKQNPEPKSYEELTLMDSFFEELLAIQHIINTVKSDSETRKRYMGIMGVIDYERRNAFEAGERLGHECGLEEGKIQGAIDTCKFMNLNKEQTKEAIIKQFSITDEIAEEYLCLYW